MIPLGKHKRCKNCDVVVWSSPDPLPADMLVDLGAVLEKHGYAVQRATGRKWSYGDQSYDGTCVEVFLRGELK